MGWRGRIFVQERPFLTDPRMWRGWTSERSPAAAPLLMAGGFLQSWTDTDRVMQQPALDHHLVVLHQVGPKRVQRDGAGGRRVVEVQQDSITTVEAGSVYHWHTDGPIGFSHLYIDPQYFAELVGKAYDRDPASVSFAETIGRPDPEAAALFRRLLALRGTPDEALTADAYFDALLARLAGTSTWGGEFCQYRRLSLAPYVVRRVRAYIRDHIDQPITLEQLAAVAGYSRYHFVRAFKDATGMPPYAYVVQERIGTARELLRHKSTAIADVARRTGFTTHAHFSTRFRQVVGLSPAEYRQHVLMSDVD